MKPREIDEASLLFGLGRAAASTAERGRLQDVVDLLDRAFEYYEREGDTLLALAVAEYPLPSTTVGRTEVSRFLLRALKLVPADSLSAGRLLSSYGAEIGRLDNNYNGAQEAFARALSIAQKKKDSYLKLNTLLASANVALFHLHIQEALENAENAIKLASRLGAPQAAWAAYRDANRCLGIVGDSRGALRHASMALELSEKQRARYRLAQALEMNASSRRLHGDWQAARDFVDRGLTLAPQDETLLRNRIMLEYDSGDFVSGDVALQSLLEVMAPVSAKHGAGRANAALTIACVARISGATIRVDHCIMIAQEVVSSPLTNPAFAMAARAALGVLSVLRNDPTKSAEQYAALTRVRGSSIAFLVSGDGLAVDRVLGLMAHTMGDLDQASAHFEIALALCSEAGYRPELAWTCCDYAETLLQRNHHGDHKKAMSLLDQSLSICTQVGMRPLMDRVALLREQTTLPTYPDGLTEREVEILRLVAAGKSNPEIALNLVVSPRTVSTHVSNILNKIGATNRTEAATYASRNGMLEG